MSEQGKNIILIGMGDLGFGITRTIILGKKLADEVYSSDTVDPKLIRDLNPTVAIIDVARVPESGPKTADILHDLGVTLVITRAHPPVTWGDENIDTQERELDAIRALELYNAQQSRV